MAQESQVVEITSREELDKFMKDFANGGGVGVQRNGERYFLSTLDRTVEIKPSFRGDMTEAQMLSDYIEICFGAPRRSAELKLNPEYQTQ